MGHSAGGVFTQVLLDHGFGAAGVAINSAPTEGVKRVPLSQIRATFPVLKNPANRHRAVGFTHDQWHYAFTNGFSEEESQALYERYHIPASGAIFWGSALANIHPGPGRQPRQLRQRRTARRCCSSPAASDHLMPPSLQHSNAKHYKPENLVTEVKEFDGPHLLPAWPGWEEVADYALDWALEHAREPVTELTATQSARGSGSGVSRASICSRRSSRNGGRMILVPSSATSRPSTRKPGSSVASS